MILLTGEDYQIATEFVDDIIDNTNVTEIKDKLYDISQNYQDKKKRQFLVLLNVLFADILVNELTCRCNEAEERAIEAIKITKELNTKIKKYRIIWKILPQKMPGKLLMQQIIRNIMKL